MTRYLFVPNVFSPDQDPHFRIHLQLLNDARNCYITSCYSMPFTVKTKMKARRKTPGAALGRCLLPANGGPRLAAATISAGQVGRASGGRGGAAEEDPDDEEEDDEEDEGGDDGGVGDVVGQKRRGRKKVAYTSSNCRRS